MAAIVSGWVSGLGLDATVRRMLLRGAIGQGASAEYLTYRDTLDLPNPETVISDPTGFPIPKRADQVYVIAAGVMAVLRHNNNVDRWTNAGTSLGRIASEGNPDIAVSLARDWIKIKPEGASPDAAVLSALIPLLKEAKLI
jgi:hypothetical protein